MPPAFFVFYDIEYSLLNKSYKAEKNYTPKSKFLLYNEKRFRK